MFKIGDLVIYGNSGVCRVAEIGPSMVAGADKDKEYYALIPIYSSNSKIYTPCDNDKIVMRSVISREEANELINDIVNIGFLTIDDEKNRESIYKSVIRGCNCRDFVSIIKTIYVRKQTRLAEGKKVTASDEKYFSIAEDKLYGELAVVLGEAKENMREFIKNRIEGSLVI